MAFPVCPKRLILPFLVVIAVWQIAYGVPSQGFGARRPWDDKGVIRNDEIRSDPLPTYSQDDQEQEGLQKKPRIRRHVWELVGSTSDVISPGESGGNMEDDGVKGERNSSVKYSPRYHGGSSVGEDPRYSLHHSSLSPHLNVQMRLNKLEYFFSGLKIFDDDCRQRLLCELSREPAKFAPLSAAFLDEVSYMGDEKILSARLLASNDGTRLLTYMEAAHRGLTRGEGCDIWAYRCPHSPESLIDFKSLLTWREVIKWLTVRMVARRY